eukprot:8201410-Ditylum_brightwellii.AAC.1
MTSSLQPFRPYTALITFLSAILEKVWLQVKAISRQTSVKKESVQISFSTILMQLPGHTTILIENTVTLTEGSSLTSYTDIYHAVEMNTAHIWAADSPNDRLSFTEKFQQATEDYIDRCK